VITWPKLGEFDGRYTSDEEFIDDLKRGELKTSFSLSEQVFGSVCERVNSGDKELAKLIAENKIVLLLSAGERSEIEGLVDLAEACRDG